MKSLPIILQIVPKAPGPPDGVSDYALTVAKKLRETYAHATVFAASESASIEAADGFEVLSPLASVTDDDLPGREYQHLILHYVNYGYHNRGVPFGLFPILRKLHRQCRGRLLTVFHELYASAPPWKSAFWLRPFQIRIARSISRMSDACIVSSEASLAQLQRLRPGILARVHPVLSNFGEPSLSSEQLANRSPHRWIICGGTALVERSLRSFRKILDTIPQFFSPHELFVLGGNDNPAVRSILADLPSVRTDYRPQIAVAAASQILSTCSFAWLDYFHRADVPTAAVLKSTAFAAACAHGVIPVFPHPGSAISVRGDALPGPYFICPNLSELPAANERIRIAAEFYAWYHRRASSDLLVRGIASALALKSAEVVPS